MIRVLIGLGAVCWVGYTLLPTAERHRVFDPLRDFVPQPKPAHADEGFVVFFKRFLAEQRGPTRIDSKVTSDNRCMVPGVYLNGRGPFEMIADSGAPDLWIPVSDLPRLGISRSSLTFTPFPGSGWWKGGVAWITLAEVRIGNFVAHNVHTGIADQMPLRLLSISVMRQGHMEVQGDTCSLTFPHNAD